MSRKTLLVCMCLLTAATTFAEEITLKPNWKAGESKEYSLVQYEDTSKTSSIDVSVKILEDKENYKISCTYTNEQDYTGMGEMAKALLGKELYDKISQFVPIYTASKEGEILSVVNFNDYRKILEVPEDTTDRLAGKINGLMTTILKSMIAADEKGFLDLNMKEICAMHKYFGKTYDTKKETKGTTNITYSTMNLKDAKSITQVSKSNDIITLTTTAKLPEKECLNAITQWMQNYMAEVAKETGTSPDDPKVKKQIDNAIKEFKNGKITAESQETASFDAKTGWMISYKCVQTLRSKEGNKSETLIVETK